MTNINENKKETGEKIPTPEVEPIPETVTTPPTIDVGDAADPFERLQTKKVPLVQ